MMSAENAKRHNYLRRLEPEYYRGHAYVHWSMTIEGREKGWLTVAFHHKFRELLTHTMFRYQLCCPIYCCMPDHFHLLWIGSSRRSDQRVAIKFLRGQINLNLTRVRLQRQPYDHVLRDVERERSGFEEVAEYIARNPERASLVRADGYADYEYTGCLVPGYPDMHPFQDGYWDLFWRLYSEFRKDAETVG